MTKLYDTDHPYYCATGCYFASASSPCHQTSTSWQAFKQDGDLFYNADEDYNLLFRWDWGTPDPMDYDPGEVVPAGQLELRYMIQRKGYPFSVTIDVTREDEPEVREWLQQKWEHLKKLWAPFSEAV